MSIPTSIKEHRLSWFFGPIWNATHVNNDMFSAVYCARPKKGKSWLTLSHAWILDRGENDKPRFPVDCSRVFFTAGSFAKALAEKKPAGTVFILDDAGLNLFSREAMTRTVIDVAKIFQSVRYKNYIILLSLPAYNMLDKAVRTLMGAYVQPNKIDEDTMRVRAGVRFLGYNPHHGEIFYRKPIRLLGGGDTWISYDVKDYESVNEIWFDAPPEDLRNAYEEKKDKCLGEYYDGVAKGIVARELQKGITPGSKLRSFASAYKEIIASPDDFGLRGKNGLYTVEIAKVYEVYPDLPEADIAKLYSQVNLKVRGMDRARRAKS